MAILFVSVFTFRLALPNSSANNSDASDIVLTASFETQNTDSGLLTEGVQIVTGGTSWRTSNALLPFKKNTQPLRNSSADDKVDESEWGIGQAAKLAPGNSYAPGNCTWYAYNRRWQLNRPVGVFWGNGGVWHYAAAAAGYAVNHIPEVGAVIDFDYMHVAIVEEVGLDNSVHISEMNVRGLYSYNERWVKNASRYWYIH